MKKKTPTTSTTLFVIIFLMISGMLFSCIRDTQVVVPADTTKRWLGYRQNDDDTITTQDGYAYLSTYNAISASGTSIVSNNRLKGDFEVRIAYSSFVTSGNNSFSDQLIFNFSSPAVKDPLIAATLTNDYLYLDDSTRVSGSKSTVNREGEVYIKREDSTIYSWIRAGGDTLFLNKTNYYSGDVGIEMKVYASDNTATHTSVHIDDIKVKGGKGLIKSNTFDDKTILIVE